jgi:pilus assembly protein CpaE
MDAPHILLVEDSQVVLFKLKAMLVQLGYTVTTHTNPVTALKWLKESGTIPNLVITDINMPEMDGFEFIRTLRSETATTKIPVIVLTSKKDVKDKIAGLKAGADDYLEKTVTASEFELRIKALLSRTGSNEGAVTEAAAKTITLFSLKGGVGTTTISVNLSIALAQLWKIDVCLWDMALSGGHCAYSLNLVPKYSLAAWGEKLVSSNDDTILSKMLMKHDSGVTLMPAPVSAAEAELVTTPVIDRVWTYLLAHFPYLVIDAGNHFSEATLTLLERSDRIILVTAPEILSVRSTADALQILLKMNIDPQKIMVVVNNNFREYPLQLDTIISIIGEHENAEIPFDSSSVIQSIQTGKPLLTMAPKSEPSLAISTIAYRLSSTAMENQGTEHSSPFLDKIRKLVS